MSLQGLQMTKNNGSTDQNSRKEWSKRCAVTDTQFQLPQYVAEKIAFKSTERAKISGAAVDWYYLEERDKVVLSSEKLDSPGLEHIARSSLSGVSNTDIENGNVSSGKVNLPTKLPDDVYDRLVTADEVVLKVVPEKPDSDNVTFASVYSAERYDQGKPVDITSKFIPADESDSRDDSVSNSNFVGVESKFVNYI